MIDLLILIFFSIVVALSFLVIARQWLYKRKLVSIITQLTADNILLKSEIQRLSELSESFPHEETEGFIKFLSQSRDWAFTYIEDVQKAMQELFVALMGAEEEQIKKAAAGLVKFLPEEDKKS